MPRQPQPAPFEGALVINKPQGRTSHDIVDAVRHIAGFRQVGHLGTLDPLATDIENLSSSCFLEIAVRFAKLQRLA